MGQRLIPIDRAVFKDRWHVQKGYWKCWMNQIILLELAMRKV